MNDRLYRSRSDRMLAGVAGGLAEIWDADPSLVRIVWALLVVLTGGIALLVYIIMAIVVPEEEDVWPVAPMPPATGAPGEAPAPAAAADAAGPGSALDPATGLPLVVPPPEPGALWAAPPVDTGRAARMEARAARRAARAERGASGGISGAMIGGLVLIALGAFFLLREWLPQFDFDWFWPMALIALGVLVLVMALGRKPTDPGSPS